MITQNSVSFRVYVVERQSLIAQALHAYLDANDAISVVGHATAFMLDDVKLARPDLIVFGLDNSTCDLADAIAQAKSVLPVIRFCALSSFLNPDILERSLSAGADGFVVKDTPGPEIQAAFVLMAGGACYVDPRAAALLMSHRQYADSTGRSTSLNRRELAILRLISIGCSNQQIAQKLGLAEKTVKNYNVHMYKKLGVGARTEAMAYAVRSGLV